MRKRDKEILKLIIIFFLIVIMILGNNILRFLIASYLLVKMCDKYANENNDITKSS